MLLPVGAVVGEWDTATAGTGDGVNYNSERNFAKRMLVAPLH
jgi:hypothetical protein